MSSSFDGPEELPRQSVQAEPPQLDFDDAQAAFGGHSTSAMLRSLAVFSLCSVQVSRGSRPIHDNHPVGLTRSCCRAAPTP